ncbi:hypothetical protein GGF43_000739, partial [Coemansia sp. RSA 2618]
MDVSKGTQVFKDEIKLFRDVLSTAYVADQPYGLRMEARMRILDADEIVEFVQYAKNRVLDNQDELVAAYPTKELLRLKRIYVDAVDFLAGRLKEHVYWHYDLTVGEDMTSIFLQQILYGIFSRPSDFNSLSRDVMKLLGVPRNMELYGKPMTLALNFRKFTTNQHLQRPEKARWTGTPEDKAMELCERSLIKLAGKNKAAQERIDRVIDDATEDARRAAEQPHTEEEQRAEEPPQMENERHAEEQQQDISESQPELSEEEQQFNAQIAAYVEMDHTELAHILIRQFQEDIIGKIPADC